jgi:probable biosynthetic protein (TIGR04098 family)
MKQYLHIIQKELPSVTEEDLITPIRQTHIDSLDIVVIRVALEKHFGLEISDSVWYQYQTLSEALEYFHKNKVEQPRINKTTTTEVTNTESVEIRMPQMANSALSENWLLKYLGDYHWQLLSKSYNLKSSEFADDNGNRLYATFVRISYTLSNSEYFWENDVLDFEGSIESFGKETFISSINGTNQRDSLSRISAKLITVFSVRERNNNSIQKGIPNHQPIKTKGLEKMPLFLNEYRLLNKNLLASLETNEHNFSITDNIILESEYQINPYYDINGVGLLYFAAYPIIADSCIINHPNLFDNINHNQAHNIDIKLYTTVFRDIFYFANCASNDKIIVELNTIETDYERIYLTVSLRRKSDNKKISKIFTILEHPPYT